MKTFGLKHILLSVMISFAATSFAQKSQPQPPKPDKASAKSHQERREEIEAMKIAYITKKLELTTAEAQQFWPVYNEYNAKVQEIRKKRREDYRNAKKNFETMTDKEVEQSVDNEMTLRQKELDLQKEYHTKFKAVLPIKKVARLYTTEEQFKRVLLDKLKDKETKPEAPKE